MELTSVQELVKSAPLSIPRHFLQQGETALLSGPMPAVEIPTVDYMLLASPKTGEETELHKLHSACKEWGIFQVVNHGMNPRLMEQLRSEIEEFYKLPLEEKMKYGVRDGDGEGYDGGMARMNGVRDWGDRLYMTTNPIHLRRPHLLPRLPSPLRDKLETYIETLKGVAKGIMGSIEEALGMEENEMAVKMEEGLQSIRMSYYPPCPQPELVLGFTPHSDATCITILTQVNGVQGLQVNNAGCWLPVNILPHAFVVLVGDILQVFSNGVYESVEHRVTVNPKKERISMSFFVNPNLEAEIGPAATLVRKNPPCRFKSITTEQYFKNYFSRVLHSKSNLDTLKINN